MRVLAGAALVAAVLASGVGARTQKPALRVTEKLVGTALYVEGSIGYVRIRTRDGRLLASDTFAQGRRELRFRLEPGTYRVVSFQRPCDGNCGFLDPPTDRCSRLVGIRALTSVAATILVSPGKGCTIRLS